MKNALVTFCLAPLMVSLFTGCESTKKWLNSSEIAGFGDRQITIMSQVDVPATVYINKVEHLKKLTKDEPVKFIQEYPDMKAILFEVVVHDPEKVYSLVFECPEDKRELNENPTKIKYLITPDRFVKCMR